MIEFHGWLTLRESPAEIDSGELPALVRKFEDTIAKEDFGFEIMQRYINGSCQLWISGNANHKGPDFDRLIEIINDISNSATGSYGLIYLWDDEDSVFNNEFQVFVIKRGIIRREKDHYLSPCVPIIEDKD